MSPLCRHECSTITAFFSQLQLKPLLDGRGRGKPEQHPTPQTNHHVFMLASYSNDSERGRSRGKSSGNRDMSVSAFLKFVGLWRRSADISLTLM
jgi:hypothetical protein